MEFTSITRGDELIVISSEPDHYSFDIVGENRVQDNVGQPNNVYNFVRNQTEYSVESTDVVFCCSEHGYEPDSITMSVSRTYTDGTSRDWEGVSFTVSEPENGRVTRKNISLSDSDYVRKTFDIEKVRGDLAESFRKFADEDEDCSRIAERGSCSEKEVGRRTPTCFPRVVLLVTKTMYDPS